MREHPDRIPHIVDAIEAADEVEVLLLELGPGSDYKSHPVGNPSCRGSLARGFDRGLVVVVAHELRHGIGLRHQDRRGTMTATDVRDGRSGAELSLDAFQRGDPVRHQMGRVAIAEDAVGARVESRIMLVPADPLPGLESFCDLRLVGEERLPHPE